MTLVETETADSSRRHASPAPSARTVFIRDLTDGQAVEAVFLVSDALAAAEEERRALPAR